VSIVLALVVVSVLTVGTVGLLTRSTSNENAVRLEQIRQRTAAVAEGAAEVMLAKIAAEPLTSTSVPPAVLELDGYTATATAQLDVPSGRWTVRGAAGAVVVVETAHRDADGRVVRESWAQEPAA
jgi:hypothetical protein